MHSWVKGEAPSLRSLLSVSRPPSLLTALVSYKAEEMISGWEAVRPCAEYDCTVAGRRRRPHGAAAASTLTIRARDEDQNTVHLYMSGQLDEDYSYVYTGGLSSKAGDSVSQCHPSQLPLPPPKYHAQTLLLDPVTPFRSSQLDTSTRSDLANIISMQMKPELLVEQLIIENRLRTMSLAAFPLLEGIGSNRSGANQKLPTKSHSTPTLVPQHRKHRRRKPRAPLEWCELARGSQPGVGEGFLTAVQPFDGRSQGDHSLFLRTSGLTYTNKKDKGRWAGDSIEYVGGPVPLPVVAPTLEPGEELSHATTRWRPNKLTSLLPPQ